MTGHDDLLARADWFFEDNDDIDQYGLVADLAAAVRSERAAREKAEALYMHATARADETQARLTDLANRIRGMADNCNYDAWHDLADSLDVPAADTATEDQT